MNHVGNTQGNLDCDGLLAQQGEWLYYSTGEAICRAKEIGKDEEKISEDAGVRNINVVGDWIYYNSGGIYRIKTDGSEKTCLYDDEMACEEMVVKDQTIYFRTGDQTDYGEWRSGDIYTMNVDGTGMESFKNGECSLMGIHKDHLYFMEDNVLKRIKPDGTDEETVYSNLNSWSTIAMEGDWLYCAVQDETSSTECMLGKLNLISKEWQPLCEVESTNSEFPLSINVKGDWIYYEDIEFGGDEGSKCSIAKIKTDGTGHEMLITVKDIAYPFSTEGGVYAESPSYDEDEGEIVEYIWTKID